MQMVIFLVISIISLALYLIFDLLPIYRNKEWKVFWIYLTIIFTAFVFHVLTLFDVDIPSPTKPIKQLVYFIFGLQD